VELNDLLHKADLDPAKVIAMRHRPDEPGLRKVLPWLVERNPAVFNAYQRSHSGQQEEALRRLAGKGWVASFFGLVPGEAVFCGLYEIRDYDELDQESFWAIPENVTLRNHGMLGWARKGRERGLWFDLRLREEFHINWIGRLVVGWPGGDRSWWRRSERNVMPIKAIQRESYFVQGMPDWHQLVLSWAELQAIPESWEARLREWRGIYFIHDASDGKGYVGSACGGENLLGRWLDYARNGDGGNKLLRLRDPVNFRFSILERASPDLPRDEVVAKESSWKKRLHTMAPHGLNAN
jgi:hypothetical protein